MKQAKNDKEVIFAKGKMFELVHIKQPDGRIFEIARRAPGVRLVIADKDKRQILLTKEYRHELGDWDYRLPGGKVFDSLDEYNNFRKSGDNIHNAAIRKAIGEALEETGIEVSELVELTKSTLGATIEWDLYVFDVTKWLLSADGQKLEPGEQIVTDNWFSFDEVISMILRGAMHEERIALILLQWIKQQQGGKL